MAKKHQSTAAPQATRQNAVPALFIAAFFAVICLSSHSAAKVTAILCVAAALALGAFGFSRLRERFHLPMVALALVTLMGGISTFYAVSGKFALQEFLKVFIAFCVAVAFLAGTKGDGIAAGRRIASVLEWGAALSGVVSIDLISTRLIRGAVIWVLGLFIPDYNGLSGVEAGVRMTSIFGNPNIFAGVIGIGVLLSLGLVLSSPSERERMRHTVCLYINALSFVLAFSMGAIACIVLAFLVYLLLEHKQRRAALFVLMVETLVVTMAGVVLVAMTSLDAWSGMQPVPLLCLILGAAALCLLEKTVGRRVSALLENHSRVLIGIIAAALAAAIAFVLLAYSLTGSAELSAGESLRRSAYPEPGEYTLDVQADGDLKVTVTTQNRWDTMMHTETTLYTGPVEGAAFAVPEDSLVVWFTFSTANGAAVESAVCQGAQPESVPLGYKLLPGFIANRIQGLFANQNAIQRTVFFEDGMKIFARSPIVGLGMGSYENAIKSVQSFYYETKYAHNHYIQSLAETGVIGLVLFLGLLGISAAAVLLERKKKEEAHPLAIALGAALVFMAGHAAVEVDFSAHSFLIMAFGVFALISLCCGESVGVKRFSTEVRERVLAVVAVLIVVFSGFLASNMMAANKVAKTPTFDSMEKAIKMDAFERNDYMLSYVINSGAAADIPRIQQKAQEYAERLTKVDSNVIPVYLAEYYFRHGQMEQGLDMLEKYVRYVSSDAEAWGTAFDLLLTYSDGSDLFQQGVARVAQVLREWNQNNLGTVELREVDYLLLTALGIPVD